VEKQESGPRGRGGPSARAVPAAWFWGLVAAGGVLDQVPKLAAFAAVGLVSPPRRFGQAVIPGFLYITPRYNPGMAFSIGRGLGESAPFVLVAVNIAIVGVVIYMRARALVPAMRRAFDLAMGLVLSGALGNIIDRLHPPFSVMDFLDFGLGSLWRYPTFNVADAFIVAGVGSYVFWALWCERKAAGR